METQTLLTGLMFGESPRWHEGRIWFANWGAQQIIAVDLSGRSEIVLNVPTTIPFCLDWLPNGQLLVVSGREGLVLRQEADGQLVTHADLRSISTAPWNEIVVDGRGNVYVNGSGFDMLSGAAFAPGMIALVTSDGAISRVVGDLAFPNGMAVTPDNKTLIIAESYANRLTAFDIAADGSLSNRRIWADLGDGFPDGICLDAENAIWYADVPNKCCVQVREGGKILQKIDLDRGCFSCALGGTEGKTLFLMAAEWNGPESMAGGARTGMVLVAEAPTSSE